MKAPDPKPAPSTGIVWWPFGLSGRSKRAEKAFARQEFSKAQPLLESCWEALKSRRAAEQEPGNPEHWEHAEELADRLQRPTDVRELYRSVLDTDLSASMASEVGQRAVRFHEAWFGEDSPELPELLERVLEIPQRSDKPGVSVGCLEVKSAISIRPTKTLGRRQGGVVDGRKRVGSISIPVARGAGWLSD